jgi:hypothetical protein
VEETTPLHFRFTVRDGAATDSVDVVVTVEPPPIEKQPGARSTSGPGFQPISAVRPGSTSARSPSINGDPNSWDIGPPSISPSDVPPGTPNLPDGGTIDANSPVWFSPVRYLGDGAITWTGPDPAPPHVAVSHSWVCDPDGACDGVPGGPTTVPRGSNIHVYVDVTVTDLDGVYAAVTQRFDIGGVQAYYGPLHNLVAPSISGTPDVGNTLTGNPGRWDIEDPSFQRTFKWVTCADGTIASCTDIPDATDPTYQVQAADAGTLIRFVVIQQAREITPVYERTVYSSAVRSDAMVNCGTQCYVWTVQPAIDRDGVGGLRPVTNRPAKLLDDGTFHWNDPSAPPAQDVATIEWFTCTGGTCASTGVTGSQYAPSVAGVDLEAHLTIVGIGEDGQSHTGQTVVPFGAVLDINAGPVAVAPPSITVGPNGPFVGFTLTAVGGTFAGAVNAPHIFTWYRCVAANPDQCTAVGATGTAYTIQNADLTFPASVMRVDETASGFLVDGSARSAPSPVLSDFHKHLVTAPTIDGGGGGPRVGVQASATDAVWSEMPATTAGPELRWQICSSTDDATCGTIPGAVGPTYVVGDGLDGFYLRAISVVSGQTIGGSIESTSASPIIGPIQQSIVPVTADTDLPGGQASIANGETLTVTGTGSGYGGLTFSWTQTGGPQVINSPVVGRPLTFTAPATGVGTLEFTLTVQDSRLNTATADIAVQYGDTRVPQALCQALAAAQAPGFKQLTFGAFVINFLNATVTGPVCDESTTITIPSASVTGYGWISINVTSVTFDVTGITITGGIFSAVTNTPLDGSGLTLPAGASLTIPFDGDGTYELVGAVVGNSVPGFLTRLFDPWQGATRLAFGNAGGVQTITFSGRAWDSTFGAASPVGGQLPTPPAGSPVIDITGSISTSKTFSLALSAAGLLTISGTPVDFTGSVTHSSAGGPTTFTASGALRSAVPIATNVSLESASLSWDGSTFSGSGSVLITGDAGNVSIDAAFDFSDPKSWSAKLSMRSGRTWMPVRGLTLVNVTASGFIGRTPQYTQWGINLGADTVKLGNNNVVLDAPSLQATGYCVTGAPCTVDFAVTTALRVTAFGGSFSSNILGHYNAATKELSLVATLGGLTIAPGFGFNAATLHIDKGADGLALNITAAVQLFGRTFTLTITYDSQGTTALVDVGTWLPFTGAPTMNNAFIVYTSYNGTVQIGDKSVAVTRNSVQLSASTGVPDWFGNLVGDKTARADVQGTIGLSPLQLDLTLTFSFNRVQIFSTGGVTLRADAVSFRVIANGSSFSSSLSALGTLTIPSIGSSAPADLDVAIGLEFDPTTFSISGSLSLVGSGGGAAWLDAFGVPGLNIVQLTIAVGISAGQPRLGFAGTVVLPNGWVTQIGVTPGAPITLAASIGASQNCFAISIGSPGQANNAIDIANLHAVTAKYANLVIAPSGCTIGQTIFEPGLSLAFDGAVLGVQIKATVAITPRPFAMSATFELGDINLKGLSVHNTAVHVEISPTVKAIDFNADADIFGVTAHVDGSFSVVNGVSRILFDGTIHTPNFQGFQLNELTVNFEYLSSPQTLTITALGDVVVLGSTVKVAFTFQMFNGRIIEADGSADVHIVVGQLVLDGHGDFHFSQNNFPDINITGTATAGGRALSNVSASLHQGSLWFAADLAAGGVFSPAPHVSGAVAWKSAPTGQLPTLRSADGNQVAAQPGDFRFDATGIGLPVSGFNLTLDLGIGRVGGVFFAKVSTQLNVGLDYFQFAAQLTGSFDSTGNFSLAGTGNATIGGVANVGLTFNVAKQSGTWTVGGSGTINIPSLGSVAVSGSFTKDPTYGTLYSLQGSLALRPGGYDFGNAKFYAYRVLESGYTYSGMSGNFELTIPDVAAGTVYVSFYSNGHFEFDSDLSLIGRFNTAVGNATARFSFRHGATGADNDKLRFSVTLDNVLKIPISFTVSGEIGTGGTFDVSASFDLGPYSESTDLGVCTGRVSAGVSLTLRLTGGPNAFSATMAGKADASASCGSLGVSVGLRLNFTYVYPYSVTFTIKLHLDFGVKTWNPTLFSG